MTAQSTITVGALAGDPAICHAFFTRHGGVSSGLYGILIFAVLAVFLAGLMVGRTP